MSGIIGVGSKSGIVGEIIETGTNANYSATVGSTGGGYVRARDIESIATDGVKVLTRYSDSGNITTMNDEPIVTVQVFGD